MLDLEEYPHLGMALAESLQLVEVLAESLQLVEVLVYMYLLKESDS